MSEGSLNVEGHKRLCVFFIFSLLIVQSLSKLSINKTSESHKVPFHAVFFGSLNSYLSKTFQD